jgi:hypothetical protein
LPGSCKKLILGLEAKHGKRVVVLVDEYDKPIIEHIHEPARAGANREVLRGLYGILKGLDAHLRFVFLTGVSKFTRLSLFSVLNNLLDVTLDERYADVCGFTASDFDELFSDRLAEMVESGRAELLAGRNADAAALRGRVFQWYDGYSWDGRSRVFNPFSLLSFFSQRVLMPYWYSSGAPTFLIKALRGRADVYSGIQGASVTTLDLDSHEIEDAPPVSLLFQTGFLTVQEADFGQAPPSYRVGFPNLEVSTLFAKWRSGTELAWRLTPPGPSPS